MEENLRIIISGGGTGGTHFPRSLYCQRHQGTTSRSGNSVRRC